jgi:hypothetical protein
MRDLLSDTDLWTKVLALLVGIVTLITAVITLRKSRAEKAQVAEGSSLKLLSFRASEASPIWNWLLNAGLVAALIANIVMLIVAAFALYRERSLVVVLIFAFFGACAYANIRAFLKWRRGQVWTISRQATLSVQGNYDQVMENCIRALSRMKVRLTAVDSKSGTIEGKTRFNWRGTYGEIIAIQIDQPPLSGPGGMLV